MTAFVAPLGGVAAIRIAVQDVYLRVGSDPALAPYLREIDRRRVRAQMIELLEASAGDELMAGMLAQLGAAPALVAALVAHLAPLRDEIVERTAT